MVKYLLQAFVGTHGGDSVALNKDVATGQQLQGFQCCAIGPEQALPPLHKLLLQPD
jgi:hypothetical protein